MNSNCSDFICNVHSRILVSLRMKNQHGKYNVDFRFASGNAYAHTATFSL